jgi:hypothetical protein
MSATRKVTFAISPVISWMSSISRLKSAPVKTIFFTEKFVMNGNPKPKGMRSKMFRSEVFRSSGVSVIRGNRFKFFPAVSPCMIRFGKNNLRRRRD